MVTLQKTHPFKAHKIEKHQLFLGCDREGDREVADGLESAILCFVAFSSCLDCVICMYI